MSKEEKNVYDIVVRYYLAQFLGNYKYDESFIAIECEEEKFTTKGIVPQTLGWKEAIKPSKEEGDNQTEKTLPQVSKDEVVTCDSLEILNKKTTPPKHYTDATLISAMKNCGRKIDDKQAKEMLSEVKGIGTEATRADVIETLKDREYIIKKGKSIISTDKGKEIIKQLPNELTSVMITANWEQKLTSIAKGQYSYDQFIKDIAISATENIGLISSQLGKVKRMVQHPCPKCGSELIRIKKKDEKKKGYYWMCDQIQEGCTTFMDDKDGTPVPQAKAKIADEKCPKCKSKIQLREGSKGKFWSCTNYPDCKSTFPNEKGKPLFLQTTKKKCPKCDSELRQMKGKKGLFWGCTNYPKCKQIFSDKDGKPKLKTKK
jgi:DNA topoisomerase-3